MERKDEHHPHRVSLFKSTKPTKQIFFFSSFFSAVTAESTKTQRSLCLNRQFYRIIQLPLKYEWHVGFPDTVSTRFAGRKSHNMCFARWPIARCKKQESTTGKVLLWSGCSRYNIWQPYSTRQVRTVGISEQDSFIMDYIVACGITHKIWCSAKMMSWLISWQQIIQQQTWYFIPLNLIFLHFKNNCQIYQ